MAGLEHSKHYFRLKGRRAEDAINNLAFKSFLREWCYPNPKDPDGKEICDLLVCFDDVLIIAQIKDIKFDGNEDRYIRKSIEHPTKQLLGAERRLFSDIGIIELTNPNGFTHLFDPKQCKRIYRVILSVGDGDIPFNIVDDVKDKIVHTFDLSIEVVLNELDTISDFCGYLNAKEKLNKSQDMPSVITAREIDLLGDYIIHGKSFNHLQGYDMVAIETGTWEYIQARPEFAAKKNADKVSYFWDHLIDVTHTCPGPDYRQIARELSRLNRFERRYSSHVFLSAHGKAAETGESLRRYGSSKDTTYVFMFAPKNYPREHRAAQLNNVCLVARDVYNDNPKVIGIATEIDLYGEHTYDFFLLDFPEWFEDNHRLAQRLQKKHNILVDLKPVRFKMDEYPEIQ